MKSAGVGGAVWRKVSVAGLVACVAGTVVSTQTDLDKGLMPRVEAAALRTMVDRVMSGQPASGDAWLKWNNHFMRTSDERVYVPFTLVLDDLSGPLDSVALYVRAVPRGTGAAPATRVSGSEVGTPLSVPERQFSHGTPTAGEASARLGLMASELTGVAGSLGAYFIARLPDRKSPSVSRSLVLAPGAYDVYFAIRERAGSPGAPRSAVMQSTVSVPDLRGNELTTSSIILADRIVALNKGFAQAERIDHPYAFNKTEVFPRFNAAFTSNDVLSIVFFVYNLATDRTRLPDASVALRFRRVSQFGKLFGEMEPARYSRVHTPPAFDDRAGHQLAVTQALPLSSFPPDSYELEAVVSDNLSGRSIVRSARFVVGEP
jgi:hypothetical protein